MNIKKLAASAAAIAMLAAQPAAAQPAAAGSQDVRESAALQQENGLEGFGIGAYIIAVVVIGLAIWGIIELTDDDEPASP